MQQHHNDPCWPEHGLSSGNNDQKRTGNAGTIMPRQPAGSQLLFSNRESRWSQSAINSRDQKDSFRLLCTWCRRVSSMVTRQELCAKRRRQRQESSGGESHVPLVHGTSPANKDQILEVPINWLMLLPPFIWWFTTSRSIMVHIHGGLVRIGMPGVLVLGRMVVPSSASTWRGVYRAMSWTLNQMVWMGILLRRTAESIWDACSSCLVGLVQLRVKCSRHISKWEGVDLDICRRKTICWLWSWMLGRPCHASSALNLILCKEEKHQGLGPDTNITIARAKENKQGNIIFWTRPQVNSCIATSSFSISMGKWMILWCLYILLWTKKRCQFS